MIIAVTGATGYIGRALVAALREHQVIALVRDLKRARVPNVRLVQADLESHGAWASALVGCDAIVHLAGENVAAQRWNAQVKQRIRESRVETTRTIVEAIAKSPPKVLVTASGVEYYPFADDSDFDDDEVTEAAPPADSFMGRLCRDWEREARAAEAYGVRVCSMRTGLVVGPHGEALKRLGRPFRWFAGGRLGSGRQWVSWIHLDDVVAGYKAALTDERYRGPINLVTESVRNAAFANKFGKVLHRPSWLPAPGFAVKAVAGEFAESVLHGRRVVPTKLRELGFAWKHPDLEEALASSL